MFSARSLALDGGKLGAEQLKVEVAVGQRSAPCNRIRTVVPFLPSRNSLAGPARSHGGEAEPDGSEISARGIERLASLFDRAKQFAHGAGKTFIEPGAFSVGRARPALV